MKLKATIDKIIFTSDTGFNIMACSTPSGDPITVTADGLSFKEDGVYEFEGKWKDNPRYGKQFVSNDFKMMVPSTTEGMKRFLARYIDGVGPMVAEEIVKKFGEKTFEILDNTPDMLISIRGISNAKKTKIIDSWVKYRKDAKVLSYMEDRGCSGAAASKVLAHYKDNAMNVVELDPYRIIRDVKGIGFKMADSIALHNGIGKRSSERVQAALIHTMNELDGRGETAIRPDDMLKSACEVMGMSHHSDDDKQLCIRCTADLISDDTLIEVDLDGAPAYFRSIVYHTEKRVAKRIEELSKRTKSIEMDVDRDHDFPLSPSQKRALDNSAEAGVVIITGGPGVGKTTMIKEIAKSFPRDAKVIYCSPTGKAAKRLSDSVNSPAATIHRTLGFDGKDYQFNEDNQLDCDVLILDEASMLDLWLTNSLLKAIPDKAKLILVGDEDQLPSVGIGAILRDLISSQRVSVNRLTEVHRQKEGSGIIGNAGLINSGKIPRQEKDFHIFKADNDDIQGKTVNLMVKMAEKLGVNVKEVQVLTPMHNGPAGTIALNKAIQEVVNPSPADFTMFGGNRYGTGDKVIQIENDHTAKIYNGDSGVVTEVFGSDKNKRVTVSFEDGKQYTYAKNEMKLLNLAWALSVHKSQGSEYAGVVMPVTFQHYVMLARNLFYTGVTRAKEMVALVGSSKAIAHAVKNTAGADRLTGLCEQLKATDLPDLNEVTTDSLDSQDDLFDQIDEQDGQRVA